MAKAKIKSEMTAEEKKSKEFQILSDYMQYMDDTKQDLIMRTSGVPATRGASGYQLVGYKTLEQFYRGDQHEFDPPPGGAQSTDNYCAVIVDNLSSLIFDDSPEINCPTDDPTDDLLELQAEAKEKLLWRVWKDNDYEVEFDDWSKQGSQYGDAFLVGPYIEKVDANNNRVAMDAKGTWKICFNHIENPASVRPIFEDSTYKNLEGYILSDRISLSKANRQYGLLAKAKNIKIEASEEENPFVSLLSTKSKQPMCNIDRLMTKEYYALFINGKLLDFYVHNWGFVGLEFVKNNYIPNHAFGKSDIEDILDPQRSHNTTNNDLANLLKWISTINLVGKNVEGMQALVAGLSRIYSIPEDGSLEGLNTKGSSDPYITNTFVQQRRGAIVEISGVSEALLSSSQISNASGRALALAFQGTIRKLNPRAKRYRRALQSLNRNIFKLLEIYYPETKAIIQGDYRNEVHLPTTLLRNIVDTINKFQSGLISHDTAMREAGVAQPNLERKIMRKDLMDPVLGPQVARQPALLPRLSEAQNQPGENPMAGPGQGASASQAGAVAANNSQAAGGAPAVVE